MIFWYKKSQSVSRMSVSQRAHTHCQQLNHCILHYVCVSSTWFPLFIQLFCWRKIVSAGDSLKKIRPDQLDQDLESRSFGILYFENRTKLVRLINPQGLNIWAHSEVVGLSSLLELELYLDWFVLIVQRVNVSFGALYLGIYYLFW